MDGLRAFEAWKGLDGLAVIFLRNAQLIKTLQIKPELHARAKEMRQAQGRISRDGTRLVGLSILRASSAALMFNAFNCSAGVRPDGWPLPT
jgi:hypothetical protein